MPQTPPFTGVMPRKLTGSELARAIRLDMEAEFDAINLYAAHVDATDDDEAKAILDHVMGEEKEHAALFLELIKRLDAAQRDHLAEASAKYQLIVRGASKEAIEAVGEGGAMRAQETPAVGFTVGALRGR